MKGYFPLIGFIILISLIPLTSTGFENSNPNSAKINSINSLNISSIQFDLSNTEIEFGNKLEVIYGFLNITGNYLANVSYSIYLIRGETGNISLIYPSPNTDLLLTSNSTGIPQKLILDTIPGNFEPLKPLNYVLYIETNFNGTNLFDQKSFVVNPTEGSNLRISFVNNQTGQNVEEAEFVGINETIVYRLTVTNIGQGNAVDVSIEIERINNPIIFDPPTILSVPVIGSTNQISVEFSVLIPDFGLSGITFKVTYNNTLNVPRLITETISFLSIPRIIGSVIPKKSIVVGVWEDFDVKIDITSPKSIFGSMSLKSNTFQFTPIETDILELKPGITKYKFNGITFQNITQEVELVLNFDDQFDDDVIPIVVAIEQILVKEPNIIVQVTGTPVFVIIAYVLFILILISIAILYFREDIRVIVIQKIVNASTPPDIKYNNNQIIVDGSNVAWEELDQEGNPRIDNIIKSIKLLKKYGFKEIIVVADAALRYQIAKPSDLDTQSRKGIIKVLPAKVDGDSFILRLSRDLNALIMTNDLYREYRSEFFWIDDRRIPYSILNGQIYLHPIFEFKKDSEGQ